MMKSSYNPHPFIQVLFILFFCSSTGIHLFSQNVLKSPKKTELSFNNKNSKEKWIHFNLKQPTRGTILFYAPAQFHCGILASASVTILKEENGDTIRVITVCNTSEEYKAGQSVTVLPTTKPDFGVALPRIDDRNEKFRSFFFDLHILKTTYGELEVNL